jgi:Zn-dependent peptidase ImmA (M78 family)
MAHIWLGESGVSNVGFEEVHIQPISHEELERFCNMLAVEFLVPHNRLLEFLRSHLPNGQDNRKQIDTVSKYFKVSRPLIARKFLEIGRISEQDYWSLFQQFKAQWQAQKDSQKRKESGHISRNILDKNHLGTRLIHKFLTAAYDGMLSYQEVSRLINVPVYRFKELES